jgi:hypothetical protein
VAGFALLDELGHRGPGVEVFDFVAESCVGDGPVHVVKVEVVKLEVREGGVDAFLDVLATMTGVLLVSSLWEKENGDILVIPELAGDPKIFSLQTSLCQTIGDAFSYQVLILVGGSTVDVSVSSLYSPRDGIGGIVTIKVPGAEP